jgi:hypothetical protein
VILVKIGLRLVMTNKCRSSLIKTVIRCGCADNLDLVSVPVVSVVLHSHFIDTRADLDT